LAAAPRPGGRSFWLKQIHQWHWISSAVCLIGMLLFAITGVTLNHAGAIEAEPKTASAAATLPAPLLRTLAPTDGEPEKRPLPPAARAWLADALSIGVPATEAEWSPEEIYLPLPRPGGDAWLSIDRESGAVEYEKTTRGVVSLLNDLHKGRNTGPAWAWFIDIFAVACVVFCLTGLFLLQFHARMRPMTWPLVGLGLIAPLLLVLLFVHL
jgi:uncharacterized protein